MRWSILLGVILILMATCHTALATKEIIITSNSLKPYAEKLANLHNSLGISSKIVTVEEIWKNYTPAKDPPIRGYATLKMPDVVGYNYTLAKKIISYLRTQIGKVEYVTLFGDAKIIPPSYYFNYGVFPGVVDTPTDYFYASPDYSMKPKFAVGRIPVNNAKEAVEYLNKLENYYSNFNLSQFKKAIFYGGKISTSYGGPSWWRISAVETWLGELDVAALMWENATSKFNATIVMASDGKNLKNLFDAAFSGGYGLVFHSDHGISYAITIPAPSMYDTRDISKLKEKSAVQPIFISDGCQISAFDIELIKPTPFLTPPQYCPSKKSFCEYLILHNPGAIVTIGSTRDTIGNDADFDINNGYVNFTNYDYMFVITSTIIKDFGKVPTIGDALRDGLAKYVNKFNISSASPKGLRERWRYQILFETELLGDPTLKLPKLSSKPTHYPKFEIISTPIKSVKFFDNPAYRYYWYPLYEDDIKIHFDENATVKIFDLSNEKAPLIKRVKVTAGENFTFAPNIQGQRRYLIRISNGEKETWYTFFIKVPKNHPPTVEKIPDVYAKVGENITVHINATDPDGDNLTCKPISIPNGARIENFTFYWTPSRQGNYTVVFEVSDGKSSVKSSFTIHVLGEINISPIYPVNGAKDVELSPVLRVAVTGAENYTLKYYSENGTFIGSGKEVVWKNLKPGSTYRWYVVVSGSFGNVTSPIWEFETTHAPVASFAYHVNGTSVTFRFNGYDPDNDSLTCFWSFGDGQKAVGNVVTHRYAKSGNYTVTLEVIDSKNASSEVSKTVSIANKIKPPKKNGPPMSKDLDGDGLYEDVNGDGKFNLGDVIYLQWNLKNPLFQKYKKYYDFYPDGKLNEFDVINLYVYWKWKVKRW